MSDLDVPPEARRALVQANLCRAHETMADDLTDEDLAGLSFSTILDPLKLSEAVHCIRAKRASDSSDRYEACKRVVDVGVNATVGEVFGERDPDDRRARHGVFVSVHSVREENGDDVYTVRYCVFPNCAAEGLVHVPDRRIIGVLRYALVKSKMGDVSYRGRFGSVMMGFDTAALILEKGVKIDEFLRKLHVSIGIPPAAIASVDVVPHVLQRQLPKEPKDK